MNADTFIKFMKRLIKDADRKIFLILDMFSTLLSKSNDLITKLLLSISAEFSCIYFFHARSIAYSS